ncbi:FAD-dependent monooxygenase [Dactylosporangium sp. CA-052675]|uniref:FAD-dependent monooxygenase n=1 Tax=Dactylosporangium sp. CA-052675 TaxID=3239927 RepID=UPI003D912C2D
MSTGHAVVIGAGIGGLAAAVALHRIGWSATVLERAGELGEIGAGMSQAPNALAALDELGVGERAREAAVPSRATGNLRTADGRFLQRARAGDTPALLAFHRADLHRVLLDAVPPGWVRTGAEVTGVRADGTVTFTGGELRADLVVAADGIGSATRRLLWPDAPAPRFLGRTAWLGVAPVADQPGSVTLGPGGYFLIHPLSRGRAYWAYVTTCDEPGIRFEDEHAEAARRVRAWHDPIPALIAATPPDAVIHIDIRELAPLPSFVNGRVALLGDAAHAMSPDRGQGAGQSLEDAVVLAAALAEEPTVESALRRYDTERRPRSQAIARSAAVDGRVNTTRRFHRPLTAMIRLTPARLWSRSIAPDANDAWRWRPPRLAR